MEEKKPWYRSKIIQLALVSILVFGSNWLSGWLTMQGVTPDQMDAIAHANQPVQDAVESVKNGGNIISAIGSLFGVITLIFRAWFTNATIA